MQIPKIMSAIVVNKPGGPEALILDDRYPVPDPKPGEVLIKIAAAGVNRADVLQRQGKYPVSKNISQLIGLEVSGIIASKAKNFEIGQQVVALCTGGGYAEYVAVPEGQILPLPKSYSLIEGAALPETLFTVQQTLMDKAGLGAGMTALIHGGSGGVGGTALQMGTLMGAHMLTTVSSDDKAAYAIQMGAQATINYKTEDFVARTLELTDGKGVDVILDVAGGDYLNRNLQALAHGGTIIQLALLAGATAKISLAILMVKSATLIGTLLRPISNEAKAAIATRLRETVWPALEDGRIKKPRLMTFSLENAHAAHVEMYGQNHIGKIVLITKFGSVEKV